MLRSFRVHSGCTSTVKRESRSASVEREDTVELYSEYCDSSSPMELSGAVEDIAVAEQFKQQLVQEMLKSALMIDAIR